MLVYLLRHASAGAPRANPTLDRKRGLDKEGKQQCLLVANCLNAMRVNLDAIVSSPLKRCLQTASLVATEVGFEQPIAIESSLEPAGTLAQFETMLQKYAGFEHVLVVGHNPNLSLFVGSLVAMPPRTSRANLRMRKGSFARVDMSVRPRQLLSLVDPRMLQQIYASVAKSSRRKTSRK